MFSCTKPRKINIKIKLSKELLKNEYPVENYFNNKTMLVPCGKCPLCRERYAWVWSKRCELETIGQQKNQNFDNYFLTLTFQRTPLITKKKQLRTYCLKLTQNFIKKIRNHQRKQAQKLKYVVVWELGDKTNRLHAHALIWNLKLNDKTEYGLSKSGEPLFLSETLNNQYWTHGLAWIGDITPKSASYCFKYSAKNYIAKFQSQAIGGEFLKTNYNDILNETQYQNKYFLRKIRQIIGDDAYLLKIKHIIKNQKKMSNKEIEKHFCDCRTKIDSWTNKMLKSRDINNI